MEGLKKYRDLLGEDETKRRSMKVFKQMGDFMGVDKTSEQIRGHHIKMKKKFRTIDEIIRLLPKELKKKERKLQKL